MSLMGYREYGRHKGVTLAAVQKAIKAGRIAVEPCGKIDSDKADRMWAEYTDQALQRKAAKEPVVMPGPAAPLLDGEPMEAPRTLTRRLDGPDWPELPPLPKYVPPSPAGSGTVVDGAGFQAARLELMRAEAEMAQIKLAALRGTSIDLDLARKVFVTFGRLLAQAREALPAQLATRLVGKTDQREIAETIRAGFRDADERIANELTAKYRDVVAAS